MQQIIINRLPSTLSLFLIVSLASMASVFYTPALPQIRDFFGVNSDAVRQTVSLFLFGYAIGQLFYAPFANRFSRRLSLFFGLGVAFCGVILAISSYLLTSFTLLLWALFIISIGTSCGLSLVFTIINDVYDHHTSRRVIPLINLSFSMMPGIGIFFGGMIASNLPWFTCFIFLGFYFCFIAYLIYHLPETSSGKDFHALKIDRLLMRYKEAFSQGKLWHYSLIWGLCTTIIYFFASTAPLIMITTMNSTPAEYGRFNLLTAAGFIIGTLITRYLANTLTPYKTMIVGMIIVSFGVASLAILNIFRTLTPWDLFLSMFFICIGIPAIASTASTLAVKGLPDKATSSSVMTFIDVFTAVVLLALINLIPINAEDILIEVLLVISLFTAFLIKQSKQIV
ncbi:MFS transporter [Chlamydiales bacterium]|nr:MFS transporter [Chlamydiales bacterium]